MSAVNKGRPLAASYMSATVTILLLNEIHYSLGSDMDVNYDYIGGTDTWSSHISWNIRPLLCSDIPSRHSTFDSLCASDATE